MDNIRNLRSSTPLFKTDYLNKSPSIIETAPLGKFNKSSEDIVHCFLYCKKFYFKISEYSIFNEIKDK